MESKKVSVNGGVVMSKSEAVTKEVTNKNLGKATTSAIHVTCHPSVGVNFQSRKLGGKHIETSIPMWRDTRRDETLYILLNIITEQ